MEIKAVSAYKRSEEKGGTIAIGNLAQKLIDAGFLDEAKERIEEALKKPDYDATLPKALARISEVHNSEEEKEKEILSIASEQKFRVEYATAYSVPYKIESFSLKWKSKHGAIEVIIQDDNLSAKGETLMPRGLAGIGDIYNPNRRSESKQDTLRRIVNYSGKVINRAIDYSLTIKTVPTEEYDRTTLAGSILSQINNLEKDEDKYTGQMLIKEECNKIFVMEKDSKGNISFYEMTPIK